jgi:hypothetical protein
MKCGCGNRDGGGLPGIMNPLPVSNQLVILEKTKKYVTAGKESSGLNGVIDHKYEKVRPQRREETEEAKDANPKRD